MNVPFNNLAWQEGVIREDRERRFAEIVSATSFVLGPAVSAFESEFAAYLEAGHCVGVSGGTDALMMIFQSLGIGEGDEVITIPTTFMGSIGGLVRLGARPVFVDIDPVTRNFDLVALERAITSRTRAILPVHLYGVPADMNAVMRIAKEKGLLVVEDACQAHGARYGGKRVGTFGDAAAFSFYPGKNLGAYGDGGAVVTPSSEMAATIRALRNQGCATRYMHEYLGYNGRLDSLQAAVLSAKLSHLDDWNAKRAKVVSAYLEAFADLPLGLPQVPEGAEPGWHLFVVAVEPSNRDAFMKHLADMGIATGLHYPLPLHLTPALGHLGHTAGDFPHTEKLAASCVSLPVFPGMTDDQVAFVIEGVHSYFHA